MMNDSTGIALLVIDMQNDFVSRHGALCVDGAAATLPAIRQLLDTARNRDWTVIHIIRRHHPSGSDAEPQRAHLFNNGKGYCIDGTWGAQIVEGLTPTPGEITVVKTRFSGFYATDLDNILSNHNITDVIIAGTQYPNCIRATAVDAIARNYHTTVCTDACSACTTEIAMNNITDMRNMGIHCLTLSEITALADTPPHHHL